MKNARTLLHKLAKRLSTAVDASSLRKPEFAERLGISPSQFRALRSAKANPSLRTVSQIARALGLPLFELLENRPLGAGRDLSADEMNAILSGTIAARYRESGMSYKEFAALLGVSIPQLYLMLRGVSNPPILTVVDLARRLALDPWILLGVRAPRTIRAGQPARGPGQKDERGAEAPRVRPAPCRR